MDNHIDVNKDFPEDYVSEGEWYERALIIKGVVILIMTTMLLFSTFNFKQGYQEGFEDGKRVGEQTVIIES